MNVAKYNAFQRRVWKQGHSGMIATAKKLELTTLKGIGEK